MTLDRALERLHAGDIPGLSALLRDDPSLVHARVASNEGHYCGYFHRATLLHHVAGNPTIAPLPANILELATLILDAGAEVDAVTEAGPSQPTDIGWTTLGLAATGLEIREAGRQAAMMELLLARGADVNARNGGPLVGALYYGEDAASRLLVERGARVDFVAAAGLGRIDLMTPFVGADGALAADASSLVLYDAGVVARTPDEILRYALRLAAGAGQRDAVAYLLDVGADLRGHGRVTPLHLAALRGHAPVCDLLLARGADATVRDPEHDATPRQWAVHGGHHELAARL
ncbi:MAG TPA: ankyrin repeat domain-containing protein [Kofleriaceae bacterium]|nr:ankyrin repeat domain-containing protein [Kofleriaceae bacterium]